MNKNKSYILNEERLKGLREYYEENKQNIKDKMKLNYKENREAIIEYKKNSESRIKKK